MGIFALILFIYLIINIVRAVRLTIAISRQSNAGYDDQIDVFNRVFTNYPYLDMTHVSDGLPDAQSEMSSVDIAVHIDKHYDIGFGDLANILSSTDDMTIYSISGYRRNVMIYAYANSNGVRNAKLKRDIHLALTRIDHALTVAAFVLKRSGMNTNRAWAMVLDMDELTFIELMHSGSDLIKIAREKSNEYQKTVGCTPPLDLCY